MEHLIYEPNSLSCYFSSEWLSIQWTAFYIQKCPSVRSTLYISDDETIFSSFTVFDSIVFLQSKFITWQWNLKLISSEIFTYGKCKTVNHWRWIMLPHQASTSVNIFRLQMVPMEEKILLDQENITDCSEYATDFNYSLNSISGCGVYMPCWRALFSLSRNSEFMCSDCVLSYISAPNCDAGRSENITLYMKRRPVLGSLVHN